MPEPQDLLIFPYNGNGLEALDCLGEAYRFIGFVDDTQEKLGVTPEGFQVFGRDAFVNYPDASVLAVPGSHSTYLTVTEVINGLGLAKERYAKVIHPGATISTLASIGFNVLIMAGVVITSNAVIGNHTCILANTVIHHDVIIKDWGIVGSNVTVAGNAVLEENCYIGSGSSIMDGLHIGSKAIIGLGSNVISNVAEGARVVGNPARLLVKKS